MPGSPVTHRNSPRPATADSKPARSSASSACRPTVCRWTEVVAEPSQRTGPFPGQLGQRGVDLRGGGPKARIFLQHLEDQGFQRRRDLRVQQRRPQRRLRQDGVQGPDRGVGREGVLARGQLVEHDAQGEEIAGAAGRLGPRLLGGHVADRAQHGARVGDLGGRGLGRRAEGRDAVGPGRNRPPWRSRRPAP